jgi:thiamine-monophosphate kinase
MELEFVAWLARRLPVDPRLRVGPGDDAAVLRLADGAECVLTSDLVADGVDFHLAEAGPRRVGRKALAVNLSDAAAMACRPVTAIVSLLLPQSGGLKLAQELYEGLLPLAERYGVSIAGGDTNVWSGKLAISVTLIAEPTARGALRRDGAQPGDRILVTGAFGGSISGRHLDFEPRVSEAMRLHSNYALHAGLDCSDGLALDLWRMTEASGCGALVDLERVPVSTAATALAEQERVNQLPRQQTALEHALGDGEDFELILAVPPEEAARILADQPLGVPVTDIGRIVSSAGLSARHPDGTIKTLPPRGWQY